MIEIDGPAHDGRVEYDDRRTTWLEGRGFRVLRFAADDVLSRLDEVLEAILGELTDSAEPPPPARPGTPPTSRGRDPYLRDWPIKDGPLSTQERLGYSGDWTA